jgi:heme/copper-type cytochrome/quinol oxidase subunit 3
MESTLSREERRRQQAERAAAIRLKNNKLGITVFQGSWIMVFLCLILVYWQMGYSPGWRPAPDQKPALLLPTIATVALLASTWFARQGLLAVKGDQTTRFQQQWLLAIVTGGAFLLIMVQQFLALPPDTAEARYGQLYRVMIGYHALHALAIGFMQIQVYRYAARYHAGNHWSVEATVRLWNFVTVAWVLFYAVLYII